MAEFFVDSSCIDCDLCRQIEPRVYERSDRLARSVVAHQPASDAEQHRALIALVTCPTHSIGTTTKVDSRAAARALPEEVTAGVYFCGWAAESSYGAAAWLIVRPAGNVLVDSPRAASTLFERLDELGGVATMVLTHRDDVADHARFAERFHCERVLHAADASHATRGVERLVDGTAPIAIAPDLAIVPVPGHTRGSIVLIHAETHAFTGDHVWANDEQTGLEAGRDVCWYSWREQAASMRRLAEHRFSHVLPGHGRQFRAASAAAMRAELVRLAGAMQA